MSKGNKVGCLIVLVSATIIFFAGYMFGGIHEHVAAEQMAKELYDSGGTH